MNSEDREPNAVVSDGRHITLTRDPELARRIIEIYHWEETEQKAIERCMQDMAKWADKGVLPVDLLSRSRTCLPDEETD